MCIGFKFHLLVSFITSNKYWCWKKSPQSIPNLLYISHAVALLVLRNFLGLWNEKLQFLICDNQQFLHHQQQNLLCDTLTVILCLCLVAFLYILLCMIQRVQRVGLKQKKKGYKSLCIFCMGQRTIKQCLKPNIGRKIFKYWQQWHKVYFKYAMLCYVT